MPYHSTVRKTKYRNLQRGSGIIDTVTGAVNAVKSGVGAVQTVTNIYSSRTGTDLRNAIPASGPNARSGFPGEKHQILKLPSGQLGVANYSGPQTSVVKRIRRKDPPRTQTDKVAQAHDLRYMLNKDVRQADIKMVNKLSEIQRENTDSRFNTIPAKTAIQAKMKLEDLGLLSASAFNEINKLSTDDRELLKDKLDELEQEGYGKGPKKKGPAYRLRQKLMKNIQPKPTLKLKILEPLKNKTKKQKIELITKMLQHDKIGSILLKQIAGLQVGQGDSELGKPPEQSKILKTIKDIVSTGADIVSIAAKLAPLIALIL